VTRTAQELSIVCRESGIPSGVEREGGWSLLELAGPIPFTAVGVLASVLAPLARAGVSVFVMSTFDTDYVLVKRERVRAALDAIASAARERSRQGEDRGVD
jgi:hypothetical protein